MKALALLALVLLSGCVAVRVVRVTVHHNTAVDAHDNTVRAEVAP